MSVCVSVSVCVLALSASLDKMYMCMEVTYRRFYDNVHTILIETRINVRHLRKGRRSTEDCSDLHCTYECTYKH